MPSIHLEPRLSILLLSAPGPIIEITILQARLWAQDTVIRPSEQYGVGGMADGEG